MKLTSITSVLGVYHRLSPFGKSLVLLAILLLIVLWFRALPAKEGFSQDKGFLFKEGTAIYDTFYADVYDHLVFNQLRNDYEVGSILNVSSPNETSVIADIGCGTGHTVDQLLRAQPRTPSQPDSTQTQQNPNQLESKPIPSLSVIGIDLSPSMIQKARENYPDLQQNFKEGDGLDEHLFVHNGLTHVLCLYFTLYYMKDKPRFFYNCMNWLMPGGYLVVHVVDRAKFDPILPVGNPLYIVSPQKYAKNRITHTKITFHDFVYRADFTLDEADSVARFEEKFTFHDGHTRKQEHRLYMEDLPTIVEMAQDAGFVLHAKINMVKCAYEYQYLYVFVK